MPDSHNELSKPQMTLLESKLREQQAELRAEVQDDRAKSESERDRRSAREVQDRGDEANADQCRSSRDFPPNSFTLPMNAYIEDIAAVMHELSFASTREFES